jgi:hypothetical protein
MEDLHLRRMLPFLMLFGCSEYQVRRMSPESAESNWFDEAHVEGRSSDESDESDESDDSSESWESGDDEDRDEDRDEDGPGNDEDEDEDWEDDSSDESWGDDESEGTDESSSGGGSSSPGPGEASSTARVPGLGEVIITEMMIDPDSVSDESGEWVEIQNNTVHWLDLSGHRLGDSGLDDDEIDPVESGSLVVRPGGFLVICSDPDFVDNGGVDCDGTVRWWTFGGGFAMSNTEDEVLLMGPDGWPLDRVRWVDGFAAVGEAMGLNPEVHSITSNDDLDLWCEQWAWLPFGDSGTPGETNDECW